MLRKRIQLGMIHAAVAITLVPINSTLNRIMIEDLGIYAVLVVLLFSPPYLFSFIQVAVGSFSDRHPILGLRRTPYIAAGLVLCVVGLMLATQVALLLPVNFWAGIGLGILTFGAWGMGFNLATVSYFSLPTRWRSGCCRWSNGIRSQGWRNVSRGRVCLKQFVSGWWGSQRRQPQAQWQCFRPACTWISRETATGVATRES